MSGAAGRRYAKALFALARDGKALEPTAELLGTLAAVVRDPSVGPAMSSPLLSPSQRSTLARTVSQELALPSLLAHFVQLLADRQRLGELPAITAHFHSMLDHELGRVRITIHSARALDVEQERAIIAAFTKRTGKEVIARVVVDADLLGGVAVDVAGTVYDGSVRTQLERLAKQLSGTSAA
ncbi:MAG: F0F1 ATP synthase subunit delta [Candidatus Binatia bacterium]